MTSDLNWRKLPGVEKGWRMAGSLTYRIVYGNSDNTPNDTFVISAKTILGELVRERQSEREGEGALSRL